MAKEEKEVKVKKVSGTTSPSSSSCNRFWGSASLHHPHLHHEPNFYHPSFTDSIYHPPPIPSHTLIPRASILSLSKTWNNRDLSPIEAATVGFYHSPRGAKAAFTIILLSQSTPTKGQLVESLEGSPVWRCAYTSSPWETQ